MLSPWMLRKHRQGKLADQRPDSLIITNAVQCTWTMLQCNILTFLCKRLAAVGQGKKWAWGVGNWEAIYLVGTGTGRRDLSGWVSRRRNLSVWLTRRRHPFAWATKRRQGLSGWAKTSWDLSEAGWRDIYIPELGAGKARSFCSGSVGSCRNFRFPRLQEKSARVGMMKKLN